MVMFKKQGTDALAKLADWTDTVIAQSATLNGYLKSDGLVRVYGSFEGDIESTGTVIVGKAGKVNGNISGKDIAIAGTVVGNISASGKIEIYQGGRVLGDITASNLKIEDGALFSGQSSMKSAFTETLLLQGPRGMEDEDKDNEE